MFTLVSTNEFDIPMGSYKYFRKVKPIINQLCRVGVEVSISNTQTGTQFVERTFNTSFSFNEGNQNFLENRYMVKVTLGTFSEEFIFESLPSIEFNNQVMEVASGRLVCKVDIYKEVRSTNVRKFDFSNKVSAQRKNPRPDQYDVWFKKGEATLWEDGYYSLDFVFTSAHQLVNSSPTYYPIREESEAVINNGIEGSKMPTCFLSPVQNNTQDVTYSFSVTKEFIKDGALFNLVALTAKNYSSYVGGVWISCIAQLSNTDLNDAIKLLNLRTKVNGSWKDSDDVFLKVNDVWKDVVEQVYVKTNGVWKEAE